VDALEGFEDETVLTAVELFCLLLVNYFIAALSFYGYIIG